MSCSSPGKRGQWGCGPYSVPSSLSCEVGSGLFPDCVGGSWEARPVWGAPKKVAVPPKCGFH